LKPPGSGKKRIGARGADGVDRDGQD
jgi:hypothetical protein